ncbi:MAG: neutral/alkaline non-lysosomal ceramidase N-terminal domain-containing protein [Cecembia sp.]
MHQDKPSKTPLQRFFRILAWTFGILFFVLMALFTKVDRKPYQEMDYYLQTMERVDGLSFDTDKGSIWQAGWSKVNATPEKPAKLAGYRPRGTYDFVQDSSFIRAIVLGNGNNKIAFLNYELMIIHPHLKERIIEKAQQAGLPIDYYFFTATHTHSGMGGYMPGWVGKFAFGGYNKELVQFWEEKTLQALQNAYQRMDTVDLVFKKSTTEGLVANRLIPEDPVDPYARQLIFLKKNGEKATFLTYNAHPTILERKFLGLSGDYPHYLAEALEESYDLALFAAGTMGSHKPVASGKTMADVEQYSHALFEQLSINPGKVDTIKVQRLQTQFLPLALRKAHFRIGKNVRIRPWLFRTLVGDTNPHFDIALIGNTLMITSSGEISGVFMEKWEDYANKKGLNLMITCFNGGYIGYITPDEYYDENRYEVRDMNWYGPYNGAYFDEIIRGIIEKAAQ